ncbi:MAG: enoyl-CoA hydratase-related protein [Myxococcota bacterium]|nr:enoyl-CoA hydratase-related protein [Myxococcota bacterium]
MELAQTLFERDARGVATATFNEPRRHNVMSPAFMDDLHRVMDRVEAPGSGVRALVLTGAGESFCAGGDLAWMKRQLDMTREERVENSALLATLLRRLDTLPVLTIARVNGQAYGGGVGMIAVCDVALSLPGAQFALTEVSLGLVPSNISPYVVKRMGAANARRTFLNAKRMDARLAQRLGLITEVVDDLDAAVEAEIESLLRCGPRAVAAAKRLIEWVDTHGPEDNAWYTARDLADAWDREEGQEGIRAFLEKRKPAWRS